METKKVTIELPDGTKYDFPVVVDENGEEAVDFSTLTEKTGIVIIDDDGNPVS